MLGSLGNKVYIVITPFFPSPSSWRGAYCLDFVKALKRARPSMRVEVFAPGCGNDYLIDGVCVHKFPIKVLPSNVLPFLFRRYNEQSFLKALERVGINCNDVAFCHGHTANFAIYPLAVKRRNPTCQALLHHHDLASFGLNLGRLRHIWLYNLVMFPILRRLHENIDCHIFISEMSRRSFLSAPDTKWTDYNDYRRQMRWLPYHPARIKDSIILHNGVNTKLFNGGGRGIVKSDIFQIGCVGNFEVLKDQISLIKAVERLHKSQRLKVHVKFVGSGSRLTDCKRYVTSAALSDVFEFLPEMNHDELPDFYRSLDLFVLPSFFEGFGCVYTEAWSCGVPFIACKGQGIEDNIPENERCLWLVPPHSPDELAERIYAFSRNRWQQTITENVDINDLIGKYVEKIEGLS